MEVGGNIGFRPTTNLAHELFHAQDANLGFLDNRPVNGLGRDEWRASYYEKSNPQSIRVSIQVAVQYS